MKNGAKSVLLDYDGVIVDSMDSIISWWNEIAATFGNKRVIDRDFVQKIDTGNWRAFYINELGVPLDKISDTSKIFKRGALYDPTLAPFTGIKAVISDLHSKFDLFILSSSYSEGIINFLKKHGLENFFKGIIGDEEIDGIPKDDARFYIKSLELLGLEKTNVVYAGDTLAEVTGGKLAGITTIGCTWGFQSKELLQAAQPDFIADSPMELPAIINKAFKRRSI